MLLYYAPGSSSLAAHVALRESGLPFDLIRVSLSNKKTASGADFTARSEQGYVPALELADGDLLTEGPAILQYIADLAPEKGLAPPNGTMDRYRLQEALNLIATELHKAYSQLSAPQTPEPYKEVLRGRLTRQLGFLERRLGERRYLLGERFSVADAYLFTILRWSTKATGIDLAGYPALTAFVARVSGRPSVREALAVEGLIDTKNL